MDRRGHIARGFTILEMIAVITIVGLVAVSVVPATARINDARKLAGVYEIARTMEYARARAAARGMPSGVRFDSELDSVQVMDIDDSGDPIKGTDGLGLDVSPIEVNEQFGTDIQRVTMTTGVLSVGSLGGNTVWFTHASEPHMRSEAGEFSAVLSADMTVSFGVSAVITLRSPSGLVEVSR